MQYLLGIDGGGTKTLAAAADMDGKILAEVRFGSTNFKSVGSDKAAVNYINGIFSLISEIEKISGDKDPFFKYVCIGLAGLDTSNDYKRYHEIIFNDDVKGIMDFKNISMVNDTIVGLAAGSMKENRVIIIGGTGSNCYGINAEGKQAKTNGWDYILGDEGSGFSMGIHTLRAMMRAYDGRGPETLLVEKVFEYLKIKDFDELNKWTYGMPLTKDRIASLSLILCNTAEMGDAVAIDILKKEAMEIILSIKTVVKKLELEDKDFDLVFVGKNFRCHKYFTDIVMKNLKKAFPLINFMPLTSKPVEGAVRLALEKKRDASHK